MLKAKPESIAPPSLGTRFTLHYVGQEAVLFDDAAQRLYLLNSSAAFVWTCLEQGAPPQAIADRLRAAFGFSPVASQGHVRDVIKSLQRLSVAAIPDPVDLPAARRPAKSEPAQPDTRVARSFRLLDTVFRVRLTSAEQAEDVARGLAGVAEESSAANAVVADVMAEIEGFDLRVGGETIDRCRRADQVLPMVRARLVELALRRSRDLFAINAAVAGRDGRYLLMTGEAGGGTSTIAAALAADGLEVSGGGTVVLARDSATIRPMALPIGLDEGSWPLLAARYPGLETQPIHARGDGARVRYVQPATPAAATGGAVRWVVFPQRADTPPHGLATMSKPDGLRRLVRVLVPLGARLEVDCIGRFVRWIDEMAFFELRYSRLDEAVEQLNELCA